MRLKGRLGGRLEDRVKASLILGIGEGGINTGRGEGRVLGFGGLTANSQGGGAETYFKATWSSYVTYLRNH